MAPPVAMNARTRAILDAPIVPLLLRLAWPNVLIMLAQAATGLIETWWVGKLGVDALGGMALVFPGVMLMQMISAGAMGGGISSAVARALGAGRRDVANALIVQALFINGALGLSISIPVLLFGHAFYALLGGRGAALEAAIQYSNVVFAGNILLWLMNALASVIRGTGNMLVPGFVICGGALVLIPLSPCLIFGWGPLPALGIAGGGWSLVLFYLAGVSILFWYITSGRSVLTLQPTPVRWHLCKEILRVGAVGTISSLQTNLTVACTTAFVAATAGSAGVAGYGTAARLEYLLIPLVFGIGAPMVAMVGTNIGAGQSRRALQIALVGSGVAFLCTEAIGILAAIWPRAWLSLFGNDSEMLAAGTLYLRVVGPFFGFFGLGLSLYFASQGAGRLKWPLIGGAIRVALGVGVGWIVLSITQSLFGLYASLAAGLLAYGLCVLAAVASGQWFRPSSKEPSAPP